LTSAARSLLLKYFLQQFPEVVDVPEKDFDERTGQQNWLGIHIPIPFLIAAALEELAERI